MYVIALVVALFAYDNKEFLETVEKQKAQGYYWTQIDCREATKGLPAVTIDTPTGKSFVCNKMVK